MAQLAQADIRQQYTKIWGEEKKRSDAGVVSVHGPRAEDLVVQPLYLEMLRELKVDVGGGRGEVADVGCGAGRWVRFFQEQVRPRRVVGIDVTNESVELLRSRHASDATTAVEFRVGDITSASLNVDATFEVVNIANVLFHVPENDLFQQALVNLRRMVKPGGCIMTTEYLPRCEMRTDWMRVRSRYTFERAVKQAGLKIAAIRAFAVFNNDPMGIDGFDDGTRGRFNSVRAKFAMLEKGLTDPASRNFVDELRAEIDRAVLEWARERVAEIEMPSQKMVALVVG